MSELNYYDLKQVPRHAPSLSTQVAREIGKQIVSGAYPQGNLVEDEAALADRYQVSRSVIRDAVKTLVGKGLLEVRRGIGTRVRPRGEWGLLDDDVMAWSQNAPPDPDVLRQLMEVRRMFEPKAARWAAERGSIESHTLVRSAIERMEAELESEEDFVIADAVFHRSILRATDNEFLITLEGVIFSALLSSIRLTNNNPMDNKESIPVHREVYEAIAARDGSKAEKAMEGLLIEASQRLGDSIFSA